MATPKSVLIDIDIRAEDIKAAQTAMSNAQKAAALYTAEIARLKKEQQDLKKAVKDGTVSAEDYSSKQVKLSTAQKEATKGLQESNKEYQNNKTVVDAAKGSNDQLRAQLSLMTKEYNSLSKEQRENGARGLELAASIKGITDKLKANESAIGDNRRNVGNYEGALRSVIGALGQAGGSLGNFGKGMLGVADAFKVAGGGVRGFGMALMSLGLPLIIAGISALVNIFKSFTPVADAVENAVTAVKAAFGALIGGGNIMEAVKQSQELLEVMRELKDTEGAFAINAQKYNNEIARLIVSSKDRTKTEEERLKILEEANKLEKQLFDETVERLDRSLNKETETFMKKFKLTKHQFKVLTEEQTAYSAKLRKHIQQNALYNKGDLEALQEKIAERAKLEGDSLVLQEKIANRTNQLMEEIDNDKQAQADKEAAIAEKAAEKRAAIAEKAAEKRAAASAKELADAQAHAEKMRQIADEFTKERMTDLDRRTKEAGERAVLLREAGVAEIEIQKYLSEQLMLINRDEQAAILDGKLAALDAFATVAKDKINREVDDEKARAAALLAIDIDLFETRSYLLEQGAIEYAASLEALGVADAARSEQIILDKQTTDAILVDLERQKSEMMISEAQRVADERKKKEQEVIQAISGSLSVVGDILSGFQNIIANNIKNIEEQARAAGKTDREIARMTKASRKDAHNMAIAAAVVQMLQGALAAYSSASAVPLAGVALGPIAAAAALAFGAAQVAQISAQKFADGGVLVGPSHSEGGIPVTVDGRAGYEAEGGEIVLTKGVYRDPHLRQIASDINVAGGGVPIVPKVGKFATGGALGGSTTYAARSASAGSGITQQQMAQAMSDAMVNAPAPVVRVSDINRVSSDVRRVQVASELR